MKKQALIFSFLYAIVVSIKFASAFSPYNLASTVQDLVWTVQETLRPIFEALIGGYSSSEFLFAKFLLLIILFLLVQLALGRVPFLMGKDTIINIIAIAVSILSIRYMQDNDLINGILLPYGVLGIALTTILPFLIFFYFVHGGNNSPIWRRLAWIFFGIVFGALWFTRSNEIGSIGNQIYGWTLAGVALALILDGKIHSYFSLSDLNVIGRNKIIRQVAKLEKEYDDLITQPDSAARRESIKIVSAELERLRKKL